MIRKVDDLGRIVIPKEWRNHSGMQNGSDVVMTYNENKKEVTIKGAGTSVECAFCDETSVSNMLKYKKGFLCSECFNSLKGGTTRSVNE